MRKIIKGVLYDTETSERIYEENYFGNRRTLYRTPNGRWFIFYHGKKEIVPKTEDEVREYLGERDVDKYLEIFGDEGIIEG